MRRFTATDELRGAQIFGCDLSEARLRSVDLSRVSITDAWIVDADISGAIRGLRVNGVDVGPLVEAELDRRHPERLQLRPSDVAGVLAAFDVVDEMWAPTVARARRLPDRARHERVDGEYSFVETLRHLLRGLDGWVTRMVMGVPDAYHEWGIPPDLPPDAPPDTGPPLEQVLDVRAERLAAVRRHLATMTDATLHDTVEPPDSTGYPQGTHTAIDCFRVVFHEEWWHHRYATRDISILEGRNPSPQSSHDSEA